MLKAFLKLFTPATRELGRLIGKTKTGIKLYERTGKYGERILTSVKKDGSVFKEITQTKVKSVLPVNTTMGIETMIKDFDKNITVFTRNTQTSLHSDCSWLNRNFKKGDVVKHSSKDIYKGTNPVGYNDLIIGNSNYSLVGDASWNRNIHERLGLTRIIENHGLGTDYPKTIHGFEMHDFKFPSGKSVHNGRVAYEKGVSALDGNYYRKTRLNPFGDNLSINYL